MKICLKSALILLVIFSPIFLMPASSSATSTTIGKPPGCYAMTGPDLTSSDCQTIVSLFPDLNADPAKCYLTQQSNTTYTTPVEVLCDAVPLPGDSIPQAPDSVVQNPPIPIGCPESNIQGSPSSDDLALCATIPVGCPGSTQQGSPAPGLDIATCPYGTSKSLVPDDSVVDGQNKEQEQERFTCSGKDCITDNPMVKLVLFAINFFGALVGVIVIIVIVWSGILYASAGSNPNQVAEAKKRITNAIIALVMYLFLFAFLQWLVPGGVLS